MPVKEIVARATAASTNQDDDHFRKLAQAYDVFSPVTKISLATAKIFSKSTKDAIKKTGSERKRPSGSNYTKRNGLARGSSVQVPRSAIPAKRSATAPSDISRPKYGRVASGAHVYIEDTSLAAAVLESQLWTSSLAEANERRSRTPRSPIVESGWSDELPTQSCSELLQMRDIPSTGAILSPLRRRLPTIRTQSTDDSRGITQPGRALRPHMSSFDPADECESQHHYGVNAGGESTQHLESILLAPEAPIALHDCDTYSHTTSGLASLISVFPLEKHFYPRARFSRPLDPGERGHWRIKTFPEMRIWNNQAQDRFWSDLERYIESGNAGWGVTCALEVRHIHPDSLKIPLLSLVDSYSLPETTIQKTYRVFCYGEVVPHIYALMQTTSLGMLKRLPNEWVDVNGSTVVSMPVSPDCTS